MTYKITVEVLMENGEFEEILSSPIILKENDVRWEGDWRDGDRLLIERIPKELW